MNAVRPRCRHPARRCTVREGRRHPIRRSLARLSKPPRFPSPPFRGRGRGGPLPNPPPLAGEGRVGVEGEVGAGERWGVPTSPQPSPPPGAERECVFGSRYPHPAMDPGLAPWSYLANAASGSPASAVRYSGSITLYKVRSGSRDTRRSRASSPRGCRLPVVDHLSPVHLPDLDFAVGVLPQNVGIAVTVEIAAADQRASSCPGLPMTALAITLDPFISQIATAPLVFCHRMSE